MVITDLVVNTVLGRVTRHPAGMHCPARDDAFVYRQDAAKRQTESVQRVAPDFWPVSKNNTGSLINVKFCTAKRIQVPVCPAKIDLNRWNKSPLRGEKPDFGLWLNTIPAVCRYAAILPVTRSKSIVPRRTMHTGRMSCHCTKKGVNYTVVQKKRDNFGGL